MHLLYFIGVDFVELCVRSDDYNMYAPTISIFYNED